MRYNAGLKKVIGVALFMVMSIVSGYARGGDDDAQSRAKFNIDLDDSGPKQVQVVNVREFGAKGNGSADDTKSIQKAVDMAKPGSEIRFPEGDYLITSPIIIRKSDISLVGNNARIDFKPSSGKEYKISGVKDGRSSGYKIDPAAFMVVGELESKRGFDVRKIGAGDRTVQMKGDFGMLKSGDLIVIAGGDSGRKISRRKGSLSFFREQNFITTIEKKNGGSVGLSDAVSIPFNAARIYKMKPVKNVHIKGFEIVAGNAPKLVSGVFMAFASESSVRDITVRNTSKSGITLYISYHCSVAGNTVTDSVKFGSAEGFGISLERSHFCVIRNNTLSNHRHGILLDHGNGNCLIEGNKVEKARTSASIDLHGEYNYFNTVRNNTIVNGKTGIVVGGGGDVHYNDGPNNAIVGNSIENCDIGIEVNNESIPVFVGKNRFTNIKKKDMEWSNVDKDGIIDLQ